MTEKTELTDLLGDPLRALPDKRGRRKLRFPVEVYEKVEVLAAGGLSQDDIADTVGVSAPTLRKYFRPELNMAGARQRAEALECLAKGMRNGNVSAAKAYLAELDKHRAAGALRERERPSPPRLPAQVRKGVKEERLEAAESAASAGGRFAAAPPPKLH